MSFIELSPERFVHIMAFGGILEEICSYLTHNDLRQLRLVCQSWRDVINKQEKFRKSICKLDAYWLKSETSTDAQLCHRWHGAYFTTTHFLDKDHFKTFWALQKESLRVLKFSKIRIPCDQILHFINEHPLLEELYFCRNDFVHHTVEVERPQELGLRVDNNNNLNYHCVCPHARGMVDVVGENRDLHPPTIKNIAFKEQTTFPLCILDVLVSRCRHTLERLSVKDSTLPPSEREQYCPSDTALCARYLQMIVQNKDNLKSLEIYNISTFEDYIIPIFQQTDGMRFPQLREISLGETLVIKKDKKELPTDNRGTIFGNRSLLDFLFLLPDDIEKIKLNIVSRMRRTLIADILGEFNGMTRVKSFKCYISAGPMEQRLIQGELLDLLEQWPHLEELDFQFFTQRDVLTAFNAVNPVLIQHCPLLKQYGFVYDGDAVANLVRMRNLTSLTIHMAQDLTREAFHLIVQNLANLQELEMVRATQLTDADFCGFTEATVKVLQETRDLNSWRETGLVALKDAEDASKIRLAMLKKLQRLRLYACGDLTEITLSFGIKFDKLREIDLTRCRNISDDGMFLLGANNSALQRVVLIKNPMITRDGINELIRGRPTLVDIRTKKDNISRRARRVACGDNDKGSSEDHPAFNRIVSSARKHEKHAPPLHEA